MLAEVRPERFCMSTVVHTLNTSETHAMYCPVRSSQKKAGKV